LYSEAKACPITYILSIVKEQAANMPTDRILKAAIIGCGAIHRLHSGVINELGGVKLAAVCDSKPDRAKGSAGENGCAWYTDYRELLRDPGIDAVHICTPHYLHGRMAVDALRAGKYVLVEKPMAGSVAQAEEMIAEDGRQGGGRLCVVFQNRYNPAVKRLREIMAGGRFGALRSIRGAVAWQRTKEYYSDDWHGKKALECGGAMINQAIHTLDLVQWLAGGAAEIKGSVSVDALGDAIEVEDSAHMFIRMKNGLPAVFYATVAYGANSPVELEAVLDEAVFVIKGDRLYRADGAYELICDSEGKPIGEKDYWGAGHRDEISDFYRCIREEKPFFIDGRQGIEAVKLVCGLYESSETGKTVLL
jgi:UDP-N-acetyl-2-amino-2-deoxyglucuronate dehydrogenase